MMGRLFAACVIFYVSFLASSHQDQLKQQSIQDVDVTKDYYLLVILGGDMVWLSFDTFQIYDLQRDEDSLRQTDFNHRDQVIYYTDQSLEAFIKQSDVDGSNVRVLWEGIAKDIAYDWVNEKLYFTHYDIVGVLNDLTSTSHEVIIDERGDFYTNGIVVDPYSEMIYFSEYTRGYENGRLLKASLTGASKTVIHDTDINLVRDMALDLLTQTLYWTDAIRDVVEKCSISGQNREVVIESSGASVLSVVDNIIYFNSPWRIHSVSVNGGKSSTLYTFSTDYSSFVRGIKVVGPYNQEAGIFCQVVAYYRLGGISTTGDDIRPTFDANSPEADFYNEVVLPDLTSVQSYSSSYRPYAQLDLLLYYSFHPTLRSHACPSNAVKLLAALIADTITILTADFLNDYSTYITYNVRAKLNEYSYFRRSNNYNLISELDRLCPLTSLDQDDFCRILQVVEIYEKLESFVNAIGETEFNVLRAQFAVLVLWDPNDEGLTTPFHANVQEYALVVLELISTAVERRNFDNLEVINSIFTLYFTSESCTLSDFEGCLLHSAVSVLVGFISKSTQIVQYGVPYKVIYQNTDYEAFFQFNLLNEILRGTRNVHSSLLEVASYIQTEINCATEALGSDIFLNLQSYFSTLASFDEAKAELDVAYIQGRLQTYNTKASSLSRAVDSNLENILIGAFATATADLAYKTAKLALAIAENMNPLGWLFGAGSVNEVLDATAAVAEAARQLARAVELGDRLDDEIKPLLQTIQRGLNNNADELEVIVLLVENIDSLDERFEKTQAAFLKSYGAYSPIITRPDLTALGAQLELLAIDACDIIEQTDGPPAVIEIYKTYLYDECLDVLVDIQALMETYYEIYDFQFELIEQLASLVQARTGLYAANNIGSSWTSTVENCGSTDVLNRYAILAGASEAVYQLETWQAIDEYCTILEYENGGIEPSVCNGLNTELEYLLSFVPEPCSDTLAFYSLPAFVNTDSDYSTFTVDNNYAQLNLTALLAGESVSFKIPDSDWLVEHRIIQAQEVDLAIFVKMFEIYLPVESSSATSVRVSAYPSASNQLVPGGTIYAMDTELIGEYFEGQNINCRNMELDNPYRLCASSGPPDICLASLRSIEDSLIYAPSIYAHWNLQVSGYSNLLNTFRPSADMEVQAGFTLCKKSGVSGTVNARATIMEEREGIAQKMQSGSCCTDPSHFFSQESGSCKACPSGTTPELYGYYCNDIDECSQAEGMRCQHSCVNTIGSYFCTCDEGYTLNDDGITCDDIIECDEETSSCEQVCTNTPGSYMCSCNDGYTLNSDEYSCDDIDECSESVGMMCETPCVNTPGSFYCSCEEGYAISADGSTCEDVNECAENRDFCNQFCTNTIGSYECSCQGGFTLSSNGFYCVDINECSSRVCDQICINTPGSYFCRCSNGFKLSSNNRNCEDLNECTLNWDRCEQRCINTYGSYRCACYDDYTLESNGYTCDRESIFGGGGGWSWGK